MDVKKMCVSFPVSFPGMRALQKKNDRKTHNRSCLDPGVTPAPGNSQTPHSSPEAALRLGFRVEEFWD